MGVVFTFGGNYLNMRYLRKLNNWLAPLGFLASLYFIAKSVTTHNDLALGGWICTAIADVIFMLRLVGDYLDKETQNW